MRKIIVTILAVLSAILACVFFWLKGQGDYTPPVISFPHNEITFTEGEDKDILLKGVTAIDETDGDVSDTLVVESVIPMRDELRATVIYYAKDKSNNVGKATRTISYLTEETKEWAELPTEDQEDELEQDGKTEPAISKEGAEKGVKNDTKEDTEKDLENKDNTEDQKVTDSKEDNESQGDTKPGRAGGDVESQNTENAAPQSAENPPVAEENTEEEGDEEELPVGSPRITLKTDQVEVAQGSHVDFLYYVEDITDDKDDRSWLWHQIYITGLKSLNLDLPGTYELYYTVTDSNRNVSNRAELTVIVK